MAFLTGFVMPRTRSVAKTRPSTVPAAMKVNISVFPTDALLWNLPAATVSISLAIFDTNWAAFWIFSSCVLWLPAFAKHLSNGSP